MGWHKDCLIERAGSACSHQSGVEPTIGFLTSSVSRRRCVVETHQRIRRASVAECYGGAACDTVCASASSFLSVRCVCALTQAKLVARYQGACYSRGAEVTSTHNERNAY